MLLLATFAATAFAGSLPLKLRENIRVTADIVRIGDLFENAGPAADTAVFRSPSPGRSGVVNARRLATMARRNGLHWANSYRLTEVVITRPGRLVSKSDIRAAILERIRKRDGDDPGAEKFDLVFARDIAPFYVPALKPGGGVAVLRLDFDPGTGRFNAMVAAPAGDPAADKRIYRGRAIPVVEVPVLVRAIERGKQITERDLAVKRLPAQRVGAKALRDMADIIGLNTRRRLPAGRPITARDIERPRLVKRGALVTITMTAPGIAVSARGRSLDDGGAGDVIRVRNVNSNRKIRAKITGKNIVEVNIASARTAQLSPGAIQ